MKKKIAALTQPLFLRKFKTFDLEHIYWFKVEATRTSEVGDYFAFVHNAVRVEFRVIRRVGGEGRELWCIENKCEIIAYFDCIATWFKADEKMDALYIFNGVTQVTDRFRSSSNTSNRFRSSSNTSNRFRSSSNTSNRFRSKLKLYD